jgi:hypothetical protein
VSAVRRIDLASERVETMIGRGLFDFGDIDGEAARARLQHPLGVAASGSKILVADTYNHKIKELDPEARMIRTLYGDGKPGTDRGEALALFEPGGLHALDGELYIADTNNHRVVRAGVSTSTWREVTIVGLEASMPADDARSGAAGIPGAISAGPARLLANRATQWSLAVALPDGAHASEEAPASVRVSRGGDVLLQRTLLGASWPLAFELPAQPEGTADLRVQVSFAYCHEGQGVCVPASPAWNVPVRFEDAGDAVAVLTAALA